jgi:hypothetical protein
MTCIEDPLHLYQALLLYDILVVLLVNMDVYDVWQYVYLLMNAGLAGVAMMAAVFPTISFLQNEYMGGFVGASVLVLFAVSHLSSGWAAMFSIGALLLCLGAVVETAQNYVVEITGFAGTLDTTEQVALVGSMLVAVFVLVALLYYFVGVSRVLMRCFLYSVLAWVGVRAVWIYGVAPSRYCCDHKDDCVPWLQADDWIGVICLCAWRVAAYAAFSWFRRDKLKLDMTEEIHAKQLKALIVKQPRKLVG